MDDRKKMFGVGKNEGDLIDRLEATLSKVINESYSEANCSMDECYKLARQKLDFDKRFDNLSKDRVIERAKAAGASGGKMDWHDPYLWGGQKRHGSR
jgi:hypothetical protein